MATNFATEFAGHDLAARRARLSAEHRFFLIVAILFPLVNIIGFSFVYPKTIINGTAASPLVHVHAAVMSLWVILFSVQATLISAKQIKLHMTLGIFGVFLAAAVSVVGVMTGYGSLARGAGFPGYSASEFFMVPFADIVVFVIVFGAAIYYRKNAANHKRLMLVTVLGFLPPSIARLPLGFIPDLGTIWFLGVPVALGFVFLAVDTYRNGKINRVFAAAVIFLAISAPLRMAIARTEAWSQFTAWLVS